MVRAAKQEDTFAEWLKRHAITVFEDHAPGGHETIDGWLGDVVNDKNRFPRRRKDGVFFLGSKPIIWK